MCMVFKVSRGGFYYWFFCSESTRRNADKKILETIKEIRRSQPKKEVYSVLRMLKDLKDKGLYCGKNRVAAIIGGTGFVPRSSEKLNGQRIWNIFILLHRIFYGRTSALTRPIRLTLVT